MLIFSGSLLAMVLLANTSCERNEKRPPMPNKEELMERNKARVGRESAMLNQWIERSGWNMQQTNTGLRYEIYASAGASQEGAHGVRPVQGQGVGVSYKAYLLDSTEVASTAGKVFYFRVGYDDVVSGLHEAVTLLSPGDSARIILPSYLAYGLTGQSPNVPPNAPLLYDLCLVEMQ